MVGIGEGMPSSCVGRQQGPRLVERDSRLTYNRGMKIERQILIAIALLVGCAGSDSASDSSNSDSVAEVATSTNDNSAASEAKAQRSENATNKTLADEQKPNSPRHAEPKAGQPGEKPTATEQPSSQPPAISTAPANGAIQLQPLAAVQAESSWPKPPADSGELRKSAEKLAEELVKRFPESADAWEVKARFDVLIGQTDAAESAWRRALQIDADYPYALHGMGKASLLHSDYDAAVDYLARAREARPDVAEVVHDLSKAYTKAGKVAEAAEVLKAFTEKHDDATEAFVLLGAAYQSLKKFELAKQAYERALELYPDLPRAQQGLGTVLVRVGDRERARELLAAQRAARSDEATNRTPEELFRDTRRDTSVRYEFAARVLINSGAVPLAIDALKYAIVLDDENQDAWKLLLDILAANRMWDEATQAARRMVDADDDNASYWFTLGNYQVQARRIEAARQSFRKVIELSPGDAAGYQALVQMNVQTRHDPAGTMAFARKLTEVRGVAADYELLGQAYAVAGKFEKAKNALERAIEIEPNNVRYQQAMQQLKQFLSSR